MDGHASAADICERLRRLMRPGAWVFARGARVCANVPNTNDAASVSRGLTRRSGRAGAGAAPDEDNASLPLSYEPGPAIINSSKHSFSYTQLYVVLSPTKRSPPMSFSMPAMVLIAGVLPSLDGRSLAIYGYTVNRRYVLPMCRFALADLATEMVSERNVLRACPRSSRFAAVLRFIETSSWYSRPFTMNINATEY